MNAETKKQIVTRLEARMQKSGMSQASFARIVGVSQATLSQMLNGKWELISDAMWRKASAAVDYTSEAWQPASTKNYLIIQQLAQDCQTMSISQAVSWAPGSGKTYGLKIFSEQNPNVFYLECSDHFTSMVFLGHLLRAMGLESEGLRKHERIEAIINHCRRIQRPLIILDEFDKLKDNVMLLFIELYNKLDGTCGFLMAGTPYLAKYVDRSAKRDRKGFREIYSRLGRRFHNLTPISRKDVQLVCEANGVTSKEDWIEIYNSADGDLRRVRREIERVKLTQKDAS